MADDVRARDALLREHVGEDVGERVGRVVAVAPIGLAEAGQVDGDDAQVRGERVHHRRVRRRRRAVAVDQQHRLARARRVLVDHAQLAALADDDPLGRRQRLGGAGLEVHAAAGQEAERHDAGAPRHDAVAP